MQYTCKFGYDFTGHLIAPAVFSLLAVISTIEYNIDSRIPQLEIRWRSIAKGMVVFDDGDYLIRMKIFFFKKEWNLEKLLFQKRKPATTAVKKKDHPAKKPPFSKIMTVTQSFQATQWELAYCTEDYLKDAWHYTINFLPHTMHHVRINFTSENYLLLKIRKAPWRIMHAWIR